MFYNTLSASKAPHRRLSKIVIITSTSTGGIRLSEVSCTFQKIARIKVSPTGRDASKKKVSMRQWRIREFRILQILKGTKYQVNKNPLHSRAADS